MDKLQFLVLILRKIHLQNRKIVGDSVRIISLRYS